MNNIWHDSGYYIIRYSDHSGDFDARWYDTPDDLQADLDSACETETETHLALVTYIGDPRTAYAMIEDGLAMFSRLAHNVFDSDERLTRDDLYRILVDLEFTVHETDFDDPAAILTAIDFAVNCADDSSDNAFENLALAIRNEYNPWY